MITLDQAIEIAFAKAQSKEVEEVELVLSLGRVLAQDVYSDVDMPPFNKSAMDGYACRKADLGEELELLEIIQAGSPPKLEIRERQCSKIMTGAQVPIGADMVFMVEHSQILPSGKIKFTGVASGENICCQGEDVREGDLVLKSGTFIRPQHIAMLASVGCVKPLVFGAPTVGIISTGSELVDANEKPSVSQIRNSNGPQLCAQAKKHGFSFNYYGIVPDDKLLTQEIIQKSVAANDVTVLSGGVSVGDFDFVPQIIGDLGFQIHFNRINTKPGQHTTFASKNNKYVIGLPGNPVSSFIQFEVFVLPFLRKLMNFTNTESNLKMQILTDFVRRKADKDECLPVEIVGSNEVHLVDYHGSAHIHAYSGASGYIIVPSGVSEIKKGDWVNVRPL
jgi:molybdenum cofactor synthesis domain